MTTGDRIRQARLAAGMTQTELAEKVGVKFSAIHKYETGIIKNLKQDTIAALSKALNVKPSWLMCMDDDNSSLYGLRSELKDDPKQRLLYDLFETATEADMLEVAALLARRKEEREGR